MYISLDASLEETINIPAHAFCNMPLAISKNVCKNIYGNYIILNKIWIFCGKRNIWGAPLDVSVTSYHFFQLIMQYSLYSNKIKYSIIFGYCHSLLWRFSTISSRLDIINTYLLDQSLTESYSQFQNVNSEKGCGIQLNLLVRVWYRRYPK